MLPWLLGLGIAVWYGLSRKPRLISPWRWGLVALVAYGVIGLAVFMSFLLILRLLIQVNRAATEAAAPVLIVFVQLVTIAMSTYLTTRVYGLLVRHSMKSRGQLL